jgi:uncharacterized protein YfaS (alpha-2-macroglobulin family)
MCKATAIERGLKGFLYGERGVWRPGDSLYLAFMLQDAQNKLPEGPSCGAGTHRPTWPAGSETRAHHLRERGVRLPLCHRPDAPTGSGTHRWSVGGTSFHKSIRIETVKPNRLKIEPRRGSERITGPGEQNIAFAPIGCTVPRRVR